MDICYLSLMILKTLEDAKEVIAVFEAKVKQFEKDHTSRTKVNIFNRF